MTTYEITNWKILFLIIDVQFKSQMDQFVEDIIFIVNIWNNDIFTLQHHSAANNWQDFYNNFSNYIHWIPLIRRRYTNNRKTP